MAALGLLRGPRAGVRVGISDENLCAVFAKQQTHATMQIQQSSMRYIQSTRYRHLILSPRINQVILALLPIPLPHVPADRDKHLPSSFRATSRYSVPNPTVALRERDRGTRTAHSIRDSSAVIPSLNRDDRTSSRRSMPERPDTHLGDVIPNTIRQYHDDILPLRLCQLFTSAGLGEEYE